MRLSSGTSQQVIEDTVQNQIAEKLRLAFFDYFRYYPSPSEMKKTLEDESRTDFVSFQRQSRPTIRGSALLIQWDQRNPVVRLASPLMTMLEEC